MNCPDCDRELRADTCPCGWKSAIVFDAKPTLPAYREFKTSERVRSLPSDICPECGCQVRAHMEEFKKLRTQLLERNADMVTRMTGRGEETER